MERLHHGAAPSWRGSIVERAELHKPGETGGAHASIAIASNLARRSAKAIPFAENHRGRPPPVKRVNEGGPPVRRER